MAFNLTELFTGWLTELFTLMAFNLAELWSLIVNLSLSFLSWTAYPVNIRDNILLLFPCIIVNNVASVYRVLTKLGTMMHHYTTFLHTTFQGNWITRLHFMVTFTPWWKQEKEKTKPIFESSYLRNACRDLVEIGNVGYWQWRASPQQNCLVEYNQYEVTYIRKLHYCSSCQYTHGYFCVLASWATWHITVCLDWNVCSEMKKCLASLFLVMWQLQMDLVVERIGNFKLD